MLQLHGSVIAHIMVLFTGMSEVKYYDHVYAKELTNFNFSATLST